jgi:hypothetical protein
VKLEQASNNCILITPIHWNLVEHVCVVAVQCLAIERWLLWIEGSGILDDPAADGEAALLLDHEREMAQKRRFR